MIRPATYAIAVTICLTQIPGPATAQEESGGMLVDFLEDTLSGDGRHLKVVGLEGALSSRATIEEITVSDDDGVWLTIKNAELDWNRLGLLRGRFSVNTLSAEEIDIARAPEPIEQDTPPPDPGASSFQVPELPVSVNIGELRVDKLSLGEPLIGRAAVLEVKGDLSLADGTLDTHLDVTRQDRPGDSIKLAAGYANSSTQITLDLQVIEDAGGIISTALKLPDAPPLLLSAKGEGPVDDFTADIGLTSDDTERVKGQVRLRGVPTPDAEDETSIAFSADVGGDLTPFLQSRFDPFFGTDTRLVVDGRSDPDGALSISELDLTSQALRLEGEVERSAEGLLEKLAIQGRITPPGGDTVVLPVADPVTELKRAEFSLLLDAANGDSWYLNLSAKSLATPDMSLDQLKLGAQGTLDQSGTKELSGDLQAALDGLSFSDAALAQAAGDTITLDGFFDLLGDGELKLSEFDLRSGDVTAQADVDIKGLNSGFEMDGTVKLDAADLSRFSGVAGRDLAGSLKADLNGTGAPLGGSFDFVLSADGTGLKSGMDEIDPLLNGPVSISLDALRDTEGITVRQVTLKGETLSVDAAATLTGSEGDFSGDGRATVAAEDLSLFSKLAQRDLAGALNAEIKGSGAIKDKHFDIQMSAKGRDLKSGMAQVDPLLTGDTSIQLDAKNDSEGLTLRDFKVNGRSFSAEATGMATGIDSGEYAVSEADVSLSAKDLSIFSDLAGRELAGTLTAALKGSGALKDRSIDIQAQASGSDLKSGMAQIDPLIAGDVKITIDAANADDTLTIRDFDLAADTLKASGAITVSGIEAQQIGAKGNIKASASDLSVFSDLAQRDLGGSVALKLDGSGAVSDQTFDIQLDLHGQNLRSGIEQLDKLITGRTTLKADAANTSEGLDIRSFDLNATAISAQASGTLQQAGGNLKFTATLDDVGRITTLTKGQMKLDGDVSRTGSGFDGVVQLNGPDSSFAKLDGSAELNGNADFDFEAKLDRVERLVPDFPGSLSASGNARRDDGVWTIDGKATGPADVSTTLSGTFDEATGSADMAAKGQINIGIANTFISPNQIDGTAQFDLALKGQPALDALSGTISTNGAALAIPGARQTLTGINGTVTMANSAATIAMNAAIRSGGNIQVSGPIQLTPPLNTDISIALNQLVLTDNLLYDTLLNGQIAITGALAGNSSIGGRIDVGETNINLNAATGSASAAPIPDITHVGESRAVYQTLRHAGLIREDDGEDRSNSTTALNIDILVPNKMFVRGRGLSAELGGAINIGGTTASVSPSGQIELIRGNLDLLGRRLDLTKGIIALQGNLNPYIEFESTTTTSDGQATLEISGPIDLPEVKVYSDPERPPEEALAMLLFGNRFSQLSPLVLAQMATSLAQLSGAGGDATKGLRESTGLSNVDVGAEESGAGRFGAGAYLSDELYTDFTVNTEGETEVNLNLDVTDSITLKGSVDNTGSTGIGVFFERDY
ncbi:translocation/assembly module TamB domain-containing protein [Ruegeria hyattellae]|uniref:translocation/assembly module TamB domain-containing protein n=1 Tax=Ruegeria hyattellae TaxID=3233337 RepID=UPI00355C9D71